MPELGASLPPHPDSFTQLHQSLQLLRPRSQAPRLNGPAACITVKTQTPTTGWAPLPYGAGTLPPPGSDAPNGSQISPPVRCCGPPGTTTSPRPETSSSQCPPAALRALAPEVREGLWLYLGVARAAFFGPAPCVMPEPRAQPLRLSWSNWTQVTLVSESFPCKRKPPLRRSPTANLSSLQMDHLVF